MVVSVVCPLFNEELVIVEAAENLFNRLCVDFQDNFEIVFVNDGSVDSSLELLKEWRKKHHNDKRIRLISCDINQGRGRALRMGIDNAEGDIIITTEADLSWGEDIVKRLVDELNQRNDIDFVVASTHLKDGGFENVPFNRVLISKFGNKLINALFDSNITMNTGMTRAYRKNVIKPLVTERDGKEFHLEVLLKLMGLGFKCSEIPAKISWPQIKKIEPGKKKRKSSTKMFNTIVSHLSFIVIARPIHQFGLLALLNFIICFLLTMTGINSLDYKFYFLFALISGMFGLIFLGFSVQFFQSRELLRYEWMKSYEGNSPPSKRKGIEIISDTDI